MYKKKFSKSPNRTNDFQNVLLNKQIALWFLTDEQNDKVAKCKRVTVLTLKKE